MVENTTIIILTVPRKKNGAPFFVTLLNERYIGLRVAVLVCLSDVPRSCITMCSVFVSKSGECDLFGWTGVQDVPFESLNR